MATGSRSKSKFSEEDYQALLANIARAKSSGVKTSSSDASENEMSSLAKAPVKRARKPVVEPAADAATPNAPELAVASMSVAQALGLPSASMATEKKKRQGVKETPIMTAVRECSITVETGPKHIVIVFEGARLFTLNELLAILQFRKYIVFGYKKLWQELVLKALKQMGKDKPHFDGPCNVILFRQGAKMIDRDSFTVMFKYIIDALKDEPKKNHMGIFPDDNPDIVFSDEKRQAIGEPIIALRVELIDPAPVIDIQRAESLFSDPAIWANRPKRAQLAPTAPLPEPADSSEPKPRKRKAPPTAEASDPVVSTLSVGQNAPQETDSKSKTITPRKPRQKKSSPAS